MCLPVEKIRTLKCTLENIEESYSYLPTESVVPEGSKKKKIEVGENTSQHTEQTVEQINNFFNQCVLPVLTYGSQVWTLEGTYMNERTLQKLT